MNVFAFFIVWLKSKVFEIIFTGSKAAVKLDSLVCAPSMTKDMSKASGDFQTWNLECFHSVLNHFAGKMYAFSYKGMLCRYKHILHFVF